jgi:hypothetical protein
MGAARTAKTAEAAKSEKLRIRRKLIYEWRAAYRELGAAGLNRKRGRNPGGARASRDFARFAITQLTRRYDN